MRHATHERRKLAGHFVILSGCFPLIGSLVACSKPQTTVPAAAAPATPAAQRTFASPDDAGAALLNAAQSGDRAVLSAIFGPDGETALLSGDAVQDKSTLQDFVAAYTQMHRWREIKGGGEMLSVGADNFLFPIPLGQNGEGHWQFDTAAGKDEILSRRIGRDELSAITACEVVARAEDQYFHQSHDGDSVHQYAQRFVSDEGKQDGLYWPVASRQAPSPLEDVRDFAKAAGYTSTGTQPQPFNGYYFRILTQQGAQAKGGAKNYVVDGKMTGGFGILAYPVEYRNSGIMTFIVGPDGVVYQKDLGEATVATAQALSDYNPADGWSPAI
jgi:hypothetical protein